MITILVVFIILIFIVVLRKNYFIGTVKNDRLIFSNGVSSVNPENCDNKSIVKSNKLINKELCISINNKLLYHSPNAKLILKNTPTVNNNYKFKFLNINGNNIVIYHPETNSYLYVNDNNKIDIGQLNILKTDNIEKAKFNLIYDTNGLDKILYKLNISDKLNKTGIFSLQHTNTGLYLSDDNIKLILTDKPVNTKLMFYSLIEKMSYVDELIDDVVEEFGVDKSDENRNKRSMCSMVRGGLVPSSLIPCNLIDDIESFEGTMTNDNNSSENSQDKQDEFNFNIFNPHIKMEYQKLLKSYGKNLYDDNLESIDGVSVIDYLKNYHMSLLNKNTELQDFIDKESIKMEEILDTKMEDLELVKLNKDSMMYYTFNDKK